MLARLQHEELIGAGLGTPDFALSARELTLAGIMVGQWKGFECLCSGIEVKIAFAPSR